MYASKYADVTEELKAQIKKDSEVVAKKAIRAMRNPKPKLKMRIMFKVIKTLHSKNNLCERDVIYWNEVGLTKGSPWKKKKL